MAKLHSASSSVKVALSLYEQVAEALPSKPQQELYRQIVAAGAAGMVVPGTKGSTAKVLRDLGLVEMIDGTKPPRQRAFTLKASDLKGETAWSALRKRQQDGSLDRPVKLSPDALARLRAERSWADGKITAAGRAYLDALVSPAPKIRADACRLSPEEIAKIRARDNAFGDGENEAADDIAVDRHDLLGHLQALLLEGGS